MRLSLQLLSYKQRRHTIFAVQNIRQSNMITQKPACVGPAFAKGGKGGRFETAEKVVFRKKLKIVGVLKCIDKQEMGLRNDSRGLFFYDYIDVLKKWTFSVISNRPPDCFTKRFGNRMKSPDCLAWRKDSNIMPIIFLYNIKR